jgi:hypothetical protein
MENPPVIESAPRKPSGFDPGLRCLAAVALFTIVVRVALTFVTQARSREPLIVALAGVFIGLVTLIVISAIVWSRRSVSPRPARRWAVVIAVVWASLQLLAYLSIMFQKAIHA